MNSKKAKRLRQLTRQLQEKGVVEKEWQINGHIVNGLMKQSVLKPECGKAVYRGMKERAKKLGVA